MAWGGERGVVVVDISRRVLVAALAASSLYHPPDAWPHAKHHRHNDRQRSPSLDQVLTRPLLHQTYITHYIHIHVNTTLYNKTNGQTL